MKKRVLSMLLVVAMLAAMVVVPAQAESTETQQQTSYYCEHCKADIPAQQWLPWNENNEDPRTGHYYLAEDISNQKSQITISLDDDLNRHKICLDLRGRSYTVTGIRPFLNYGIFSIMDSVGGGEIAVTGATVNANGGFCQMTKHDNAKDGAAELNIYGGTIRKINTETEVVAYGGLIYLANGATLNLHGGKLVGGDVKGRTNSAGSVVAPRGGAIYATGANVNICGGTVTGGHAINTTVNDALQSGYGGNIYATSGSKVTVSDGSVENGYADTYGGNLFVGSTSTLEITGGSVTGGYAENAGGNITMSSNSTFKMSGGTLKDGVCVNKGGNLSIDNANAAIEITGGTLYGDLSVGNFKSFKLAGSPKIYMGKGNGLRLQKVNTAKMDISGLTDGAEIYLDGVDQVFTDVLETPDTYLTYFKDAIRADITVDENGALQVAQGTTGFCPHCWEDGKEATWTAWNDTSTGSIINRAGNNHYYLTKNWTRTNYVRIAYNATTRADVVFDMAGKTWTAEDKKIFIVYVGDLSLLDSVGGGKMTGTGNAANGGVLQCTQTGVLNMYSGTLSRTVEDGEENKAVRLGGVVYGQSGSEINIYGGTVRDGISATYYSEACKGGNIYAAGTFNMTAGAIIGGKAYTNSEETDGTALENNAAGLGGNLYVTRTANISGGHIVDGSAGNGGCIYATSNSALTITGGVIRGGLAYETAGTVDTSKSLDMHGGCIYVAGSSSKIPTVEISDAIIRGGNAREYGGNIYTTYADVTIADSVISDGVAGLESGDNGIGGNLLLSTSSTCGLTDTTVGNGSALASGGNICVSNSSAKLTLNSGLICGGNAENNGGNVYVYDGGFEMKSGIVTGGNAKNGGNIYVRSGELKIADDGDAKTPAPIVSNATIYLAAGTTGTLTDAVIENANGVRAAGALNLKGSTKISNEKKATCVYIADTGSLAVDAGFTGTASVAFADAHFTDPEKPHGTALAEENTAGGVFTGTLLLDGYNDRDYGQPAILAIDGDNKLHIGITAVVDPANDQLNWYTDLNEAATKVTEGSYMRLYAEENELTLSGDAVVDLNGKNLTVNGTGKLYGFDTENDDFEGNGTVTATNVEPAFLAPNGRWYVAVTDANGTTFHRMAIRVSNVSLRPSISGVYYKGIWECDDTLKDKISSFGVAVSVYDAPKDDFASDNDTMYTAFDKSEFVNGEAKTSVMIANILKNKADLEDGDSNAVRGETPIYAAPYVVVKDSAGNDLTIVGEDNNPDTSCVNYNLKKVMQSVDRIWPRLTDVQKNGVKTLYEIDRDELASWNLSNITAEIEDTTSDRPLKILTLGHSLAVDSAYMLNLVAATEGYTNDFEIGTLYYSGCKLYEHVEFLQNDSAEYKLYTSSSKNPNGPPDAINNVTMKEAIQDRDWDIIIMQGGVYENARDESLTNGNIQIIQDYVNQHKTNPNAIFAWHMIWAIPTDKTLQATYPNPSTGIFTTYENEFEGSRTVLYNRITEKTEKYILSDKSFVYLIPSGTAIENALSSYLEETDLHRDYAHVTDLGRVIAAYTWYCTFAGIHELDEVKLNTIPKAFLKSTADKTQDRVLTEAEKNIILESVNNALANPLQMTQSQYTVAPTE